MAGLSQENPLKDVFNKKVITNLAKSIKSNYPNFNLDEFCENTIKEFPNQGFLERSKHIKEMLKKYLPKDYPNAVEILIKSLGDELTHDSLPTLESFIVMSQCDFVSTYGKEHYDISMKAIYEMTKRFSAEGDLRTFLEVDYEKTMNLLHEWCNDPNPHVRRLVSEGTRPRLPLAGRIKRFQENPYPVLELLDKLKSDEELYVRRSVANNINDITKDNPEAAIEILKKWKNLPDKNVQWVVRHASRSLLKQGNKSALGLLGYSPEISINIIDFKLNKRRFKVGENLEISFKIKSNETNKEKVMIDYVINFVKANGKGKDKVFKMRDILLNPNENKEINKKHKLKDTSGRKHYSGKHEIKIQVNGNILYKDFFYIE